MNEPNFLGMVFLLLEEACCCCIPAPPTPPSCCCSLSFPAKIFGGKPEFGAKIAAAAAAATPSPTFGGKMRDVDFGAKLLSCCCVTTADAVAASKLRSPVVLVDVVEAVDSLRSGSVWTIKSVRGGC